MNNSDTKLRHAWHKIKIKSKYIYWTFFTVYKHILMRMLHALWARIKKYDQVLIVSNCYMVLHSKQLSFVNHICKAGWYKNIAFIPPINIENDKRIGVKRINANTDCIVNNFKSYKVVVFWYYIFSISIQWMGKLQVFK